MSSARTRSSPSLAPRAGPFTNFVRLIIMSYWLVPPGAMSLARVSVGET